MAHVFPDEFVKTSLNEADEESRYDQVPRYDSGTLQVVLDWKHAEISAHEDDQIFTVTSAEKDRIDLISYKFYQNVKYWWVIAKRNSILNPRLIPVGTQLVIPSLIHILASEWGDRRLD